MTVLLLCEKLRHTPSFRTEIPNMAASMYSTRRSLDRFTDDGSHTFSSKLSCFLHILSRFSSFCHKKSPSCEGLVMCLGLFY